MSLLEHAEKEIALAKGLDSEYDGMLKDSILEIVKVFAKQGHSGFSAGMTISILEKLLRFQPLTPLTGEDSEWVKISNDDVYQNTRCSHVFKENGVAYDIDGKVFEDEHGNWYTSKDSRVEIQFPYTPKTEYVKYTKELPNE